MHKKHFFLSNNIAEAMIFHLRIRALEDIPYQQEIGLCMPKW